MTLEEYESHEDREFRGQNALDDMKLKLISAEYNLRRISSLRRISDRDISNGDFPYLKNLQESARDYVHHFRDVAIKCGADVSGMPKKIKIPVELRN